MVDLATARGETRPMNRFFIRDKLCGEQCLISTGSEVSVIKPTCDEFLKLDLDHHSWASDNLPITTYVQTLLILNLGLPKPINMVFWCQCE